MTVLKRLPFLCLCVGFICGQTFAAKPTKRTHQAQAPIKEKDAEDKPAPTVEKAEPADPLQAIKKEEHAVAVSTMATDDLAGFAEYPEEIQKVIKKSLELTTQNLRYQFGSCDPKKGGMDCSGTVYCVLQGTGVKETPRQSDEICRWVMNHAVLYRTESPADFKAPAFSALKPGDLVFWSGTYDTAPRELPISHVMIYLGRRKSDNKPILFGASDGRTYDGQRRNGVSVFDFHIPKPGDKSAIYGYGRVPGLVKPRTGN